MNTTSDLPQPVAIRAAKPSDLHAVLRIRTALELSEDGLPHMTADRLAAEWEALGPRLASQVWVAEAADGSLLACAELIRQNEMFGPRLWVLTDHCDHGFELALLHCAEQRACAIGREEGAHSVHLFAQAKSSHPAMQRTLQQSGFVITSMYEQMVRALSELPPTPGVIAGIEIRPFALGQAAEVVYRADEEAFQDERGHTPRTFEQWRQRLQLSGEAFDPSLWLIAWDADEVAGAALGEVIQQIGWIHHLSVRRPWRHRGLGAALTRSALGAFYRQGIGTVRLNVDAQSLTNAHQLYRRLGFAVTHTYANYAKTVSLA
ncbi:MAG TPA: GNAT family N-acetyltransferase [Ktedonobacterales bacterium]